MYKLKIKRKKQFFLIQFQINVIVNGKDYGKIANNEEKNIDLDEKHAKIVFKNDLKSTEIEVDLDKENYLEVSWGRILGRINVTSDTTNIKKINRKVDKRKYLLSVIQFTFVLFLIMVIIELLLTVF